MRLGYRTSKTACWRDFREAANAPIFSYFDSNFGLKASLESPVISTQELGRSTAEVAVAFSTASVPAVSSAAVGFGAPVYDWRELQRWNISEARLPPGSIVQFRESSAWELLPLAGGRISYGVTGSVSDH